MAEVKDASDLVKIEMSDDDIYQGISYGIISRAWTFDRMGAQTRGDYGKAIFRIAVGKAVQSAIERYLANLGIIFLRDTTNYRSSDYWDIRTNTNIPIDVDIKSFHLFSDYAVSGRPSLDPSKIVSGTTGESWPSFYPMLIPRDQFDGKAKDCYIFAILSAPGSKRCPRTHDNPRGLVALPFSNDLHTNKRFQMVHFARFADQRIKSGHVFEVHITRKAVSSEPFDIIAGYADPIGEAKSQQINLDNEKSVIISNVTALHYIKWARRRCPPDINPLFEVTFYGVDNLGPLSWMVNRHSFEDVWIYPNELWCIGWITKEIFSNARKKYGIYEPKNSINNKVADSGGILLDKSFCYFYPPIASGNGGTKNENYYVLPQDMQTMDTLPSYLAKS